MHVCPCCGEDRPGTLVVVTSKRPGWAREVCELCATSASNSDPDFWRWFWYGGDQLPSPTDEEEEAEEARWEQLDAAERAKELDEDERWKESELLDDDDYLEGPSPPWH